MAATQPARIHPTAVIAPEARLADDVQVGPYAIIDGAVQVGPGCVIKAHAQLLGPLTLGRNNQVFGGAILGELPQHLKHDPNEPTRTEIGDGNIFREHVTVHRGTTQAMVTRIGNDNFFMAGSHVAHDCAIGNRCIMANGALLAGHCHVDDGAFLSGNTAIHQFVRVGRLALLSGCAISSKDIPPFALMQGLTCVTGVNIVGMRRAGLTNIQISAIREAYRILFFRQLTLPVAVEQVECLLGGVDVVQELLTFIGGSKRGVATMRDRQREAA